MTAVFAFLLSVTFWPGIVGAATSPRWALAAVSLYWLDWRLLPIVAFLFWRLDFDPACEWTVLMAALCWGYRALPAQLDAAIRGMAAGLLVSGGLALLQKYAGFDLIAQAQPPAGLFVNKNVMGDLACLVFAAALVRGLRWSLVASIPALALSSERTAWLAALVALICWLPRRWACVLLAACCAAAVLLVLDGTWLGSLQQRVALWQGALYDLTWLGNGSYDFSTVQYREPNLHNDWLQFAFEWGVIALLPLAVVVGAAMADGFIPFVAALAVAGSFSFPLHSPASAWLAVFVLGHCLGRLADDRRNLVRKRTEGRRLSYVAGGRSRLSFPALRA